LGGLGQRRARVEVLIEPEKLTRGQFLFYLVKRSLDSVEARLAADQRNRFANLDFELAEVDLGVQGCTGRPSAVSLKMKE
jgi:hypothetical protein